MCPPTTIDRVFIFIFARILLMQKFYVTCAAGLDEVVREELAGDSAVTVGTSDHVRDVSVLSVQAPSVSAVSGTRTIEDAFISLGSWQLSGGTGDLDQIRKSPVFGRSLRDALSAAIGVGRIAKVPAVRFRVVVQARDAHWRSYRRVDMQIAAEKAVLDKQAGWRLEPDVAPVEVWLHQANHLLMAGLRISSGVGRQHGGRTTERRAALRPSIAAAMVLLSHPEPDDIFMDPMCGAGTLLLERAVWGRYQMLLGGDIDPMAVRATRENFGPRHKPREIRVWDAADTGVPEGSISKIVCNLPWGRQVGSAGQLPELYRRFLVEAVRALRPGGRMVLLTSEWRVLEAALSRVAGLRVERRLRGVAVLGQKADMVVLRRAETT
jgi:23S rRNA G2445 N2-methylase RlmL